jgi:hypothetical protein
MSALVISSATVMPGTGEKHPPRESSIANIKCELSPFAEQYFYPL